MHLCQGNFCETLVLIQKYYSLIYSRNYYSGACKKFGLRKSWSRMRTSIRYFLLRDNTLDPKMLCPHGPSLKFVGLANGLQADISCARQTLRMRLLLTILSLRCYPAHGMWQAFRIALLTTLLSRGFGLVV